MPEKRIELNQIIKGQLPAYVQEEFPFVGEFLSKYYEGQEYKSGPIDLINNIDSYIKLSESGKVIKIYKHRKNIAGIGTGTIL